MADITVAPNVSGSTGVSYYCRRCFDVTYKKQVLYVTLDAMSLANLTALYLHVDFMCVYTHLKSVSIDCTALTH